MTLPETTAAGTAALRATTAEDLAAISRLTDRVFGRRRSEEVLSWLLLSDLPGLGIESRVALDSSDQVVGHVAILGSRYQWGDRTVLGLHPMLWMLDPDARGILGVKLGRWCTRFGDFSIVVGGTPNSKPIMEARGFVRSAATTELRLATAGGGPASDMELAPFSAADSAPPSTDGTVVNLASEAHCRWLAACPALESRLFSLRQGARNLGPVLLFVNRRRQQPTGRIVHVPPVGPRIGEVLRLALGELARAGCQKASYLATGGLQLEAARALGGEPFYERVIYYRDQTDLGQPPDWHLSYLEGDLAYRRV